MSRDLRSHQVPVDPDQGTPRGSVGRHTVPPSLAESPGEWLARVVAEHRAEIVRKVAALRQAEAATEAAMARYDERWGTKR